MPVTATFVGTVGAWVSPPPLSGFVLAVKENLFIPRP